MLAFGLSGALHAQNARSVPYQGVLENAGVPVDDVVTMVFRFYATQTGGTGPLTTYSGTAAACTATVGTNPDKAARGS